MANISIIGDCQVFVTCCQSCLYRESLSISSVVSEVSYQASYMINDGPHPSSQCGQLVAGWGGSWEVRALFRPQGCLVGCGEVWGLFHSIWSRPLCVGQHWWPVEGALCGYCHLPQEWHPPGALPVGARVWVVVVGKLECFRYCQAQFQSSTS